MKLGIIIGSTREGRASDKYAAWVAEQVKKQSKKVEAELLDLRDYPLPMFNEAVSPQYNPDRTPEPAVDAWLQKVAEKDAYIIVTPEYNRGTPGVLKNALDHIAFEMAGKPVGIVAHGSVFGAFSVAELRNIIPQLNAVTIPVFLPLPASYLAFDESGEMVDETGAAEKCRALVDELAWYSDALSAARSKTRTSA